MLYPDVVWTGTTADNGGSGTVGVQNGTGVATQHSFNTNPTIANGSSITYLPTVPMADLTFSVASTVDTIGESSETYSLALSTAVNSTLGTTTSITTTITDNTAADLDSDGVGNVVDIDDDNDGLLDSTEGYSVGTSARTTAWTIAGNTATMNLGNGVVVRAVRSGAAAFASGNFNPAGATFWSPNLAGAVSLEGAFAWNESITFSFENTLGTAISVLNPMLHLDRIGGQGGGLQNSASLELRNGVTWTEISGTADFLSTANSVRDGGAGTASGPGYTSESSADDITGTAAGSFRLNGEISSFTIDFRKSAPTPPVSTASNSSSKPRQSPRATPTHAARPTTATLTLTTTASPTTWKRRPRRATSRPPQATPTATACPTCTTQRPPPALPAATA